MAKIQDALADTDVLDAGAGITITQAAPGDPVIITGTAAYTDEQVRDVIGTALVAGSNVTITVNDGADTITIASSGGGGGGVGSNLVARKTADETVTSSTTVQSDDHLTFAIGASEMWTVTYYLHAACVAANADFKAALSVPAGATGRLGVMGISLSATLSEASVKNQSFPGLTTPLSAGVPATATADTLILYHATIVNSTTAGNVVLQWAQNTSQADGVTLKSGSCLVATRLA